MDTRGEKTVNVARAIKAEGWVEVGSTTIVVEIVILQEVRGRDVNYSGVGGRRSLKILKARGGEGATLSQRFDEVAE